MKFKDKYFGIKDVVKQEIYELENDLNNIFQEKTPLDDSLKEFLGSNAKRIRPVVAYLFSNALYQNLNQNQKDAICAIEIIHNSTLIHDDIIDDSEKRRESLTLNKKFDNQLAVIAGDFLLAIAMEKIINTKSIELIQLCTKTIKKLCVGEINQFFKKFELMTTEEYIEKSKNKTAELFSLALESVVMLSETPEEEVLQTAKDFSENFGIAFQLRDDFINYKKEKLNKNSDLTNGIYTAPIILADCERRLECETTLLPEMPFNASNQEADCERRLKDKNTLLSEMPFNASNQGADCNINKNLYEMVNKYKGLAKTQKLMDTYFTKALCAIESIEESLYKKALIDLVNLLKEET